MFFIIVYLWSLQFFFLRLTSGFIALCSECMHWMISIFLYLTRPDLWLSIWFVLESILYALEILNDSLAAQNILVYRFYFSACWLYHACPLWLATLLCRNLQLALWTFSCKLGTFFVWLLLVQFFFLITTFCKFNYNMFLCWPAFVVWWEFSVTPGFGWLFLSSN